MIIKKNNSATIKRMEKRGKMKGKWRKQGQSTDTNVPSATAAMASNIPQKESLKEPSKNPQRTLKEPSKNPQRTLKGSSKSLEQNSPAAEPTRIPRKRFRHVIGHVISQFEVVNRLHHSKRIFTRVNIDTGFYFSSGKESWGETESELKIWLNISSNLQQSWKINPTTTTTRDS